MDKAVKLRWIVLLSTLMLTLVAMVYPTEQDNAVEPSIVPPQAPQKRTGEPEVAPSVAALTTTDSDLDPFAPRGWQAPPPPPPPQKITPVVAAPVAVQAPAGPPPLPFRFMGRLNGEDEQVVYLNLGEKALIARTGEVLENTYKVVSINARDIEFEHIPTGESQSMSIPTSDN